MGAPPVPPPTFPPVQPFSPPPVKSVDINIGVKETNIEETEVVQVSIIAATGKKGGDGKKAYGDYAYADSKGKSGKQGATTTVTGYVYGKGATTTVATGATNTGNVQYVYADSKGKSGKLGATTTVVTGTVTGGATTTGNVQYVYGNSKGGGRMR